MMMLTALYSKGPCRWVQNVYLCENIGECLGLWNVCHVDDSQCSRCWS